LKNEEIQVEIRERKQNNNIKLSKLIDYELSNKILTLTLNHPCNNMQSNEVAFEGWSIVLKSIFGSEIEQVFLNINTEIEISKGSFHYNRLLWRIHNFSKMFTWFKMGNCKKDVTDFMTQKFVEPVMNVPSRNRGPIIKSEGERLVESLFINKNEPYYSELKTLIDADYILNQVPVGLFQSNVKNDNKIFTGGSSAIDLLGFKGEETIHLIELKTENNIKLGVISEFLFYAFIVHGLFISRDINYPKVEFPDSFDHYANLLRSGSVNRISGHLLCENYHPLLDNEVVSQLNLGLNKFNITIDRLKYKYDKKQQFISEIKRV